MSYEKDPNSSVAAGKIIKSIAKRVIKGELKNIMTLSKPVELNAPYTLLEIIAK